MIKVTDETARELRERLGTGGATAEPSGGVAPKGGRRPTHDAKPAHAGGSGGRREVPAPEAPPKAGRPAVSVQRPEGGPVSVAGASSARGEQLRTRILEATYACVARWGIGKTTIEDAAREAGVSRVTVYRYFPGGRDELISEVVSFEYRRFFTRLYEEVQDAVSLEEVMERGLAFAHRSIAEHEVLQRILETEPEVLLPKLTVEAQQTTELIADFLVPYLLVHGVAPGVDAREAAEFLARMVLSYIASPGSWDLDDPKQVAELVRAELLGGMIQAASPGGSKA